MKYNSSVQKMPRRSAHIVAPTASAGLHGIAIAPPAYRIDSVDRQSIQAAPEPGQEHQAPLRGPIQMQAAGRGSAGARPENRTGLPDNLKAGIERLSGLAMDDVRVHYNSAKPVQLQALAYTQGTQIHVGPGQERHLPHEAWHVVQQKQSRVRPALQAKGVAINADRGLEKEADTMGKVSQKPYNPTIRTAWREKGPPRFLFSGPVQCKLATIDEIDLSKLSTHKTAVNDSNIAEGRGAQTTTGKDLKTKITWGPKEANTSEGTGVVCDPIGPDHPLGSPTKSGTGISTRVQNFNGAFSGTWKQGHLLNANLGGPGNDARNLVAISQSTNSEMSNKFEDELQRRINDQGEWLHFKVAVTHKKIKDEESRAAMGTQSWIDKQLYWAKTLDVSWGAVDEDGNKTGDTHNVKLTAGEPVTREYTAPQTITAPSSLATGSINARAVTTIGEEDIILDSEGNITAQAGTKTLAQSVKIEDELMKEIEYPLSPLRQQEDVDKVMISDYPLFEPLTSFTEGNRHVRWYTKNKKSYGTEPYNKDLLKHIRAAKSKPEHAFPKKLGKLLKANVENGKLMAALKEAAKEYSELGVKVEALRGAIRYLLPEDWERLLESFYKLNPTGFQDYYQTLASNLT
jgi:hypothetical protein